MPSATSTTTTATSSTSSTPWRPTSWATPSTWRCASSRSQQAYISHVRINGNDRVYENVVRRELRNKPGDLFSKEAMERSYREIASMGHFDPEAIDPKVEPDRENGTVDINWGLTSEEQRPDGVLPWLRTDGRHR